MFRLIAAVSRSADSIVEDDGEFSDDPIEAAGLFEGDIANVDLADLQRLNSGDYSKNAIRKGLKIES